MLSELKHAVEWTPAARVEIAAVDAWLQDAPSASAVEPRLRALLAKLA